MEREKIRELLDENYNALERYIKFRLNDGELASDIVQEVCLSVLTHAESLKKEESFRPWLYKIARNKLYDNYRKPEREVSRDNMDVYGRISAGMTLHDAVSETLYKLDEGDRRILTLCYMSDCTQREAAEKIGIPLGTLKTRLTAARDRFRKIYPYNYKTEDSFMTKIRFPEYMPEYKIRQRSDEPFSLIYEGIIGWGIVPRLGEKCSWAAYDFPERRITDHMSLEVTGRCEVHGIEGVEIKSVETSCGGTDPNVFTDDVTERYFAAQLTDTHCRLLAESHVENGVRKNYTFLDGDAFLNNWGYGEDNCGAETHLRPHGYIIKEGNKVTNKSEKESVMDICGRFDVTILGKTYDTVCLMDIETYDSRVMTETYFDRDGNVILWRRFNRDDWRAEQNGKLWSEKYPENERVTINGELYVHWYDCLFDNML
ncbi:MAG: RNA polymerase sigma factor [Eubacteriales bacterium]